MDRRLSAILAADVVGYSRLMGEDEEGTLERLKRCRRELIDPTIGEFHGRIVKLIGDGALVEFASVVDAIHCAAVIQRRMPTLDQGVVEAKRICFRIGVNLGDVIVEGDDIYGDGVNVAARLEGLAEPGGICISGTAFDHVVNKANVGFASLGEKRLKNIADPVRVYRVLLDSDKVGIRAIGARRLGARTPVLIGIAVLFLVSFGALFEWQERSAPQRPSVAVLPFANLSGDPSQDYFADGLTEDIVSTLGRFPDITVISRSATFAYKGKSVRPDEIGRALNVAYLVEGSVRKTGERARVSVSLLSTARSTVLWTEQFEREIKDLFMIQDEIARQIAGALSVRLTALQLAHLASKPPSSLEAFDLVLRGRDLSRRGNRTTDSEARRLFERAIALDPGYAPAYVGLGRLDVYAAESGYTNDPDDALTRAEVNGRKALSNGEDVGGHILLGRIYIIRGDFDRALDELRHAVDLNPSDPEAQSGLADALLWSGDPKGAIKTMVEVARVQPILTDDEYVDLGIAYLIADRPDDAIATLNRSIQRLEQNPILHALLACAYATTGRKAEAASEAAIVKRMLPTFEAKDFATQLRDTKQRLKIVAALRLAGL